MGGEPVPVKEPGLAPLPQEQKVRTAPFGEGESIALHLPDEESLKKFAIKTNRQINEEGAHLTWLYVELGRSLLRLKNIPRFGVHGRWERSLVSWGINRTRATKAMELAAKFDKPEQVQHLSVEKALAAAREKAAKAAGLVPVARKRRTEGNHHHHEESVLPPTGQIYEPRKDILLISCPFEKLQVEPGSVRLICTDPPWEEKFLEKLPALGKWCAAALAPDGVAVFRYGIRFLDKFIIKLSKHLQYQWELVAVFERGSLICRQTQFIQRHESYLVFGGPLMSLRAKMVDQVPVGVKDKTLHEWAWAYEPVHCIVKAFSEPNELIACPCAGSGTVAEVCADLGRKHIGCDIDHRAPSWWEERFNRKKSDLYDEVHQDSVEHPSDETEFEEEESRPVAKPTKHRTSKEEAQP
jgi:hypothetical protein